MVVVHFQNVAFSMPKGEKNPFEKNNSEVVSWFSFTNIFLVRFLKRIINDIGLQTVIRQEAAKLAASTILTDGQILPLFVSIYP